MGGMGGYKDIKISFLEIKKRFEERDDVAKVNRGVRKIIIPKLPIITNKKVCV